MTKYRIIGNMTGNSMDAIDLVLTEFDNGKMTDICSDSSPYSKDMQQKMALLRESVYNKTKAEISALPDFEQIHNDYISQIAKCVKEMLAQNHIDKSTIDAIGFHGKTLDHNPPSKSNHPYTLQIGSGQMLADLTGITTVYDFRSDYIMKGLEGAPLVPPHNAHIAKSEGDGWYFNGGNTSNFALIKNGKAILGSDAGPFNEYIDAYIREHTSLMFDKNGEIGKQGKLIPEFLQKIFDFGRNFYETALPKSGDPAYYKQTEIFDYLNTCSYSLADIVRTFEYFAAYLAVYSLTLVEKTIDIDHRFILFGGGWKNPIVRTSFEDLLSGKGTILAEHQAQFTTFHKRFKSAPQIKNSSFGDFMEARLMADMAYYKLENKVWELPENHNIVSGIIAKPQHLSVYNDQINRAAKGWKA